MRKIVMMILLAVAGLASAQLPATMTSHGIGLPNGTTRMSADDCDSTVGLMVEGTYQNYECYWADPRHSMAFRQQYLLMQLAGYELVREGQLNDWLLAQIWAHESQPLMSVVYEFNSDAQLIAISFVWD